MIPCHWTLTLFWKFILFSKSIEPDKEAVATLLAFATNSTPLGCSRTLTPFADGGIQLLLVAREPRLLLLAMGFNSSWSLKNLDSFCWRWDSTPLGCSRTLTPFANGGIQLLLVAREPRLLLLTVGFNSSWLLENLDKEPKKTLKVKSKI